jgi:GNAT superfamily N-acetyltransferase
MSIPINSSETDPTGSGAVRIREITGPDQEEACFWLHLLQRQFPLSEQVPAGSILRMIQAKGRGEALNSHFFTAHHPETGDPLGMAWLQIDPTVETAALWYLAVAPGKEGQGYGSSLMAQISQRAFATEHCRLIVMEVETVEGGHENITGHSPENLRQIDQRNRFYMQRNHAWHLTGIHYTQQVGNQAAIPMDLLVIFDPTLPSLPAEETFTRLKRVFGDSLERRGQPQLSSSLPNQA